MDNVTVEDPWSFYIPGTAYLWAVIAYTALALVGNIMLLGVNLSDVCRLPRIKMNQTVAAIGLLCIANLIVGACTMVWFAQIATADTGYLRDLRPVDCRLNSAIFVSTSIAYLTGLMFMSFDRYKESGADESRYAMSTTCELFLIIAAVCPYATLAGGGVLTTFKCLEISVKMLCIVHVENRFTEYQRLNIRKDDSCFVYS